MNDPSEARDGLEAEVADITAEPVAPLGDHYANMRDFMPAQLGPDYGNNRHDAQPALAEDYFNAADFTSGANVAHGGKAEIDRAAVEPKKERFARLYEAERKKPLAMPTGREIAKNRETFLRNPPPGRGASFKELNAYREKAFRAGYSITASDLEAYQTTLEEYGPETVVFGAHTGLTPPGGQRILAQALMVHNPQLVERQRFADAQTIDGREDHIPALTRDLAPQAVTDDLKAFVTKMQHLAQQKPPSKTPSYAEFANLREAMRDVGVRLTVSDFETYTKAVAESGSRALRAPGAARELPLSAQILVDLGRKPAERQLVGASAERWDHVLARHPQVPPVGRDVSAVPPQPTLGQPQPPAENTLAHAPRPQMTRNGETIDIPDGYRQTGKIVAIDTQSNRVLQQISKHETVGYALADVEKAMPREQIEQAAHAKDDVQIRVTNGALAAKNITHERVRERAAPSIA